jgi:hypothetical protein
MRDIRRRRRSRGAGIVAGEPEAWGRIPPRRSTAIVWASSVSFVAWPPWMACMDNAWPRTQGTPAWAHRSARQDQGKSPFDRDDDSLPIGPQDLAQGIRAGFHVTRHQALAILM